MQKEILFTLKSPYRDDLRIQGYRFGKGEKAACIVGALRGNEVQQLYVCSQIVKTLSELERRGNIVHNKEILVIPSVNSASLNIGSRFWAMDKTDINRMFPGYNMGETTQRIAAGLFESIKGYNYGIQFASFYMQGDFIPHVRMMDTGYQNPSLANLFGLPYVVIRSPKPYDTTTLNYNWQIWETSAFSVYTSATDRIDEASAKQAVASVMRFLSRMGIIKYHGHSGYIASVVYEKDMVPVKTKEAGIFRSLKKVNEEVNFGEVIAEIIDPYEGYVKMQIMAPTDGVVFFTHNEPLVMENTVVFKIIRKIHN
ncbi:MAG: M14 family metallopeptidase [Frisingicoccus sp.]|uniref:M14 family metallopeptidase n=1 Tax=Frisingicoccus sp. TaxID=1918627 RepID=UPI002621A096|nr:M14 family metallopeptidase [Frisingicoccus sp.]MDD6231996.1 M14 family metallopeptidase [Frisingicoccus sp.]